MRDLPNIDKVDPKLAILLKDRAAPMWQQPSTDMEDASRKKLRKAREAARLT